MPRQRPKRLAAFLGKITRNLSLPRCRVLYAQKRGGGELPLVLDELGECVSGCGSYPGTVVEGAYYFYVPHSGVYRYDGGAAEKVLGAWWVDEWSVNEYGVYDSCGRSFGMVPHETGRRQTLYRAGLWEASHVRHTLQRDGNAVLTVYQMRAKAQKKLLLDGKTGEVRSILMEPTVYHDVDMTCSDTHFQVGQRQITLVPTEEPYRSDVQEDGVSLLPEGMTARRYSGRYFGDSLTFHCESPEADRGEKVLFLRPDGNDTLLTVPAGGEYDTGTEDFLLDVQYDGEGYNVWCLDTMTNETWELTVGEGPIIYSIVTDGVLAYATAPWDDYQSLWRVVCDAQGRPAALELLDDDILT